MVIDPIFKHIQVLHVIFLLIVSKRFLDTVQLIKMISSNKKIKDTSLAFSLPQSLSAEILLFLDLSTHEVDVNIAGFYNLPTAKGYFYALRAAVRFAIDADVFFAFG